MAFATQSKAFFDELSSIMDERRKDKEDGMDKKDDRPFSSLLTQDEEPTGDGNPASIENDEPEVITRGSS